MAKQIYIDENGNPIEVSGTINNASMLPISANDSTDTKTYIDTGLSGKADISLLRNTVITNYLNVSNTTGFTVTLPYTATNERYANCLIINPHGNSVCVVTLRPSTVSYNLLGNNTWTATTQDNKTFTVKPTSQSWGLSTVIVNYSG